MEGQPLRLVSEWGFSVKERIGDNSDAAQSMPMQSMIQYRTSLLNFHLMSIANTAIWAQVLSGVPRGV